MLLTKYRYKHIDIKIIWFYVTLNWKNVFYVVFQSLSPFYHCFNVLQIFSSFYLSISTWLNTPTPVSLHSIEENATIWLNWKPLSNRIYVYLVSICNRKQKPQIERKKIYTFIHRSNLSFSCHQFDSNQSRYGKSCRHHIQQLLLLERRKKTNGIITCILQNRLHNV